MKTPKVFLTSILFLFALIVHGQTGNNNSTITKSTISNLSYSNLLIESIAIEFTMLDLLNSNNKKSFISNTLLNNRKSTFEPLEAKKSLALVDKTQILAKQFMVMEKRVESTAPIHLATEKHPQSVSAVPSNIPNQTTFKYRPKSFGPLLKF